MKKITLLGDSIRLLGYGKEVPGLLGDGFEVFQPDDNCRFSKYTLRMLFDYQSQMEGSEVVHWNNGLWDATRIFEDGLFTSEEEYIDAMVRISKILKERYKTVIFATTTPVKEEYKWTKNADVERYNEIIVPVLEKMGIIINDLHSIVAADVDKYICDDEIHLSEEGSMVCAKQVVQVIKDAVKSF